DLAARAGHARLVAAARARAVRARRHARLRIARRRTDDAGLAAAQTAARARHARDRGGEPVTRAPGVRRGRAREPELGHAMARAVVDAERDVRDRRPVVAGDDERGIQAQLRLAGIDDVVLPRPGLRLERVLQRPLVAVLIRDARGTAGHRDRGPRADVRPRILDAVAIRARVVG